jgi:cell division protein FtsI/penicillin-binding protein 2
MQRNNRSRVSLLILGVASLAGAIAYRVVDLQVLHPERYVQYARSQQQKTVELLPERGTIYDRRGRELAVSVPRFAIYAYPSRIENPDAISREIAAITGRSARGIAREIRKRTHYRRILHGISPEQARALAHLDAFGGARPALVLDQEQERSYPHGRLASHVVGFAGAELKGHTGVERTLEDVLLGTPARVVNYLDGHLTVLYSETVPPERAHRDAVLTIDLVLQHLLERELDRAMQETGARAASAVLLDPATGEVLALANRPAPRLDAFGRSSADVQRNRATYDLFEPGSTMKAITAAILLEEGLVRPDSRFDCEGGNWTYRGRRIRDHEGFGTLTLREILEHSSNIGIIKASRGLRAEVLRDGLARFGFGAKTGIALSESQVPLPDLAVSDVDRAWATFGYGMNATLLQVAVAMGTLANGGVRVPPTILRGTRDVDGTWTPAEPRSPVRVVSEVTASTVTSMLEGVIERGTGAQAAVPGYRVAGKTGTSRIHVENRGYVGGHWATFAGFAPSDTPRLALAVRLESPKSSIYGGSTAAPVFSRVMAEALAYLRVPPRGDRIVLLPRTGGSDVRPASSTGGAR